MENKGFSVVMIIIVLAVLLTGAGYYFVAKKDGTSNSPMASSGKQQISVVQIVGLWKKESGGPADDNSGYSYVEIKEKEICVGASSGSLTSDGRFLCPSYQPYVLNGDIIAIGSSQSPFYRAKLRSDGKLELETISGVVTKATRVYTKIR